MDCLQEAIGKHAADYRANLEDLFGGSETIDASHQRIMERRRNLAAGNPPTAALQHRASQLLDEERYPASAFDHRLDTLARKRVARRHQRNHLPHVARAQPLRVIWL
jgi:hypothetical protein